MLASIDFEGFNQYLDATFQGDEPLAAIYERRFRDEFRVAFDAWMATDPYNNPDAPVGPLRMKEYQLADWTEAARLETEASDHYAGALAADDIGDRYVITTLAFAGTLFFAGISTTLDWRKAQLAMLSVSMVFIVYGLYQFVTLERI